jgi:type VI secretion system protein ImpF
VADITRKTRLSPPLMHVFRAAHEAKDARKRSDTGVVAGDQMVAGRRLRARQVVTESVLRREVARDLDALLNTVAIESTIDLEKAEYARKSILNFGLPDIANRTIDEVRVRKVPEEIRTAILNFEPRLAPASLQVERDMSVDADELRVRFIVRADLVCDPVHVPIEFIADVTETGKIVVNRL